MELFEQIRRDRRAGSPSIRKLAERHHVHRRTVRQALASAVPPPRKEYPQRPRPAIGAYAAGIDAWLAADQDVPCKQSKAWPGVSRLQVIFICPVCPDFAAVLAPCLLGGLMLAAGRLSQLV